MTEIDGVVYTGRAENPPREESYPQMQISGVSEYKYVLFVDQPVAGLKITVRGDRIDQVLEEMNQLCVMANAMQIVASLVPSQQAAQPPFQPTPQNLPPQQVQAPAPTNGAWGNPQAPQQYAPPPQPQAQAFNVQPAQPQPGQGVAPTCQHIGPDGQPMQRVWFVSPKPGSNAKGWSCAMRGKVARDQECKAIWV